MCESESKLNFNRLILAKSGRVQISRFQRNPTNILSEGTGLGAHWIGLVQTVLMNSKMAHFHPNLAALMGKRLEFQPRTPTLKWPLRHLRVTKERKGECHRDQYLFCHQIACSVGKKKKKWEKSGSLRSPL